MPYERLPEIEGWISKLETVDSEERIRLFVTSFRRSPEYVPSEKKFLSGVKVGF